MPEMIDFVIPWVDGSDPNWRAEMKHTLSRGERAEEIRFRDWGLLRYWFRSVENFAPWVSRIHFVTCGQCPDWLDTSHPKLHLVEHKDYIPPDCLPCFSSHPIELNMHRIPGLSELFVYFNDDTFLLRPVKPEVFFLKGMPRLRACLESRTPYNNGIYYYINNTITLAAHFNIPACVRENPFKWFSPLGNGLRTSIRNLMYLNYFSYTNLANNNHLPTPYRKDLLEKVWNAESALLGRVSRHRFRQDDDVNQWLFHNWAVASGAFYPIRMKQLGQFYLIMDHGNAEKAATAIKNRVCNMICINDDIEALNEFEKCRRQMEDAFCSILPKQSSFERY